jgi:hypothetical protein
MHKKFWLETQGKRPLGRRRLRWEDNIRIDQMDGWTDG